MPRTYVNSPFNSAGRIASSPRVEGASPSRVEALDKTQLKKARRLLGLTQAQVGLPLGLRQGTISEAELRPRERPEIVARLQAYYQAAGIQFLPDGEVRRTSHEIVERAGK